ncbi:hypothetical protein CERSUDRAFT_77046 [Gelatoporia subvermispora B]|uniref:Uncharacterized protein n=1 Tax=Ceriporiopsis subvermispora (strain B) TaxID=914234 RepID=M2Q855_CERS8|nr:hypothetical protein CERSUDRAFT_77046 [Gelatoporia subvermispora B]
MPWSGRHGMFTSGATEDARASAGELLFLCHDKRSVLVPLPKSLQDLHTTIRAIFDLPAYTLSITTHKIPDFPDYEFEIDPSAWPLVAPILHSVVVHAVPSPTGAPHHDPTQPKIQQTQKLSESPAQALAHMQKVQSFSSSGLHRLTPASSSESMRAGAKRPASAREQDVHKDAARKRVRTSDDGRGQEPEHAPLRSGSSQTADLDLQPAEQDVAHDEIVEVQYEDIDEQMDEERVEEEMEEHAEQVADESMNGAPHEDALSQAVSYTSYAPSAPSSTTGAQRRTPQTKPQTPLSKFKPAPAPSPRAAPHPVIRHEKTTVKHEKPSPAPRAGHVPAPGTPSPSRAPALPHTPSQPRTQPHAQPEHQPPPPTPSLTLSQFHAQAQAQAPNTTESFLVQIHYSGAAAAGEDEQLLFKTRGRHVVGKVLLQACRTFGIEDLYDRAQLQLVCDADQGEDEPEILPCPRHETMARVGATPGSRFLLVIE